METIFEGSVTILYIVGIIVIISSTVCTKKQKLAIIYYYSIGVAYTGKIKTINLITLLIVSLFVYEEYLSEDETKMKYIDKFFSKIVDFVFQYLVYYRLGFVLIAIMTRSWAFMNVGSHFLFKIGFEYECCINILRIIPFLFATMGIHNMFYEKHELKTYSEVESTISKFPYYITHWQEEEAKGELFKRFELISAVEDKTYFERKRGHSFLSFEFIGLNIRRRLRSIRFFAKRKKNRTSKISVKAFLKRFVAIKRYAQKLFRGIYRGHSTLEMQLIRVLFCKNLNTGRPRNPKDFFGKAKRKAFEIVYSRLFFDGLKRSLYPYNNYFRHYLVYLYVNNVQTKVFETKYNPMMKYLECENFSDCSMEKLFLAILGLNHSKITIQRIYRYYDLIESYNIDKNEIERAVSISRIGGRV